MINIPQALLNTLAAKHGIRTEVFGYICRMQREADGKKSMVMLAMGQSGSSESLVQMAWLRATFLYWEREAIRAFTANADGALRELLPVVATPEQAADRAAGEWGLNSEQAAGLRERVHVQPRIPRLDSYPMHKREPLFPLIPGFMEEYARRPTQPSQGPEAKQRRLAEMRARWGSKKDSGETEAE